jgi:hypothetical protein
VSRFEYELGKLITAEIERLRGEIEAGLLKDYAQYQNYVGKIASLRRVNEEFIDEANKKANEG